MLFDGAMDFAALSDRLAAGRVKRTALTETFGMGEFRAEYGPRRCRCSSSSGRGELTPFTADHPPTPQAGQTLVSVVAEPAVRPEFPNPLVPAPVGA